MPSFICPYCDEEIEEPVDYYETEIDYEWECPICSKNFIFTIDYDPIYYEKKAPCLNGGEHDYKKRNSFPPTDNLFCSCCGKEK